MSEIRSSLTIKDIEYLAEMIWNLEPDTLRELGALIYYYMNKPFRNPTVAVETREYLMEEMNSLLTEWDRIRIRIINQSSPKGKPRPGEKLDKVLTLLGKEYFSQSINGLAEVVPDIGAKDDPCHFYTYYKGKSFITYRGWDLPEMLGVLELTYELEDLILQDHKYNVVRKLEDNYREELKNKLLKEGGFDFYLSTSV